MEDLDFVFSDEQFEQLNKEYIKQIQPNTGCINSLNSLIRQLEKQNFQMPLSLQNNVLNTLLQAQQLLEITYIDNSYNELQIKNNPFELIFYLSQLSTELNSHTLKSAYQILYLKTNNLILDAIKQISNYFTNKNLKIFKFI